MTPNARKSFAVLYTAADEGGIIQADAVVASGVFTDPRLHTTMTLREAARAVLRAEGLDDTAEAVQALIESAW
jgi:predicted O-methyltransferase YrrM